MTLRQALVYNLLSALTCYIGFFIGVFVGNLDAAFTTYTFGFAGGMFLYIALACMVSALGVCSRVARDLARDLYGQWFESNVGHIDFAHKNVRAMMANHLSADCMMPRTDN